ncbi:MAG: ParB/RepB/Spo0J family partition protein [Candidatus Liptonbacteria bacterium]|nr:ParB/RepB/Spo0J family partition protein [Candidatus Liptonbacteria bacterium]
MMLGKGLESLIPKKGDAPDAPQGVPPRAPHAEEEKQGGEARRGAGRVTAEGDAVFHIEVEKIRPNPYQPRKHFNEAGIRELADSIREFGMLQPLVVLKVEKETDLGTDVSYELIAGERRLMAAKMLGLPRVPVVIRRVEAKGEGLEMAVVENLQRENLNPIETARAFSRLQDEFRLTQREIAHRLGKSRETVANAMRLLGLPSHIQEALAKGQISETHGRLLLAVDDKAAQEALFRDLLDKHLTTREMKMRVASARPPHAGAAKHSALTPELVVLQEKLSSELGAPVKIEQHGETGKITISFYSGEELQHIVERLGGREE